MYFLTVPCVCIDLRTNFESFFSLSFQSNLVLSLLYNCLSIPLAAGVFYPILHRRLPPTVAALAMALSSVSVVFSSLALRLYHPPIVEGRSNLQRKRRPDVVKPLLSASVDEETDHVANLDNMEQGQT